MQELKKIVRRAIHYRMELKYTEEIDLLASVEADKLI